MNCSHVERKRIFMGTWGEQDVDGHRCDVFLPGSPSQYGYTLIYLHDLSLRGLKGRSVFEDAFEQYGFRVVVPHTGRSWWSDKLCIEFDPSRTAEHYLTESIISWIDSHWGASPPQIGLLGMGMGGQGGLRLGFKYPDTFPLIAAIAPSIDYQQYWREESSLLSQMYPNEEAVRQDTATLHIHPLYWPRNIWFCADPTDGEWAESIQRLSMKLSALGIPHQAELETISTESCTHYEEQMAGVAIQFLAERMDQERRRMQ